MPMTRAINRVAVEDPSRIAIAEGAERLTYRELQGHCHELHAAFASAAAPAQPGLAPAAPARAGAGAPRVVAVCVEGAFDAARLFVGAATGRFTGTVLDAKWPLGHRVATIRRSGAALVITDDAELAGALRDAADWRGEVRDPAAFPWRGGAEAAHPDAAPLRERDDDDPFLLLFTSGTTENPKAFLRTCGGWRYNVAASSGVLRATPGMCTIAPGPLSYSLTLYALVEALATGGSIHLQRRFDAPLAARTIAREGIERIVCVPAMLPAIVTAARRGDVLGSLRVAVTGGANLSRAQRAIVEEALADLDLVSYYGAAEIGFIAHSRGGDGTLLTPFDGVEVRVLDERGDEVPPGDIGELHVRVASTADGYLDPATAGRLQDAEGWATVHDLAAFDGGALRLMGRAGDIAVTGGHKVSLPQVERALADIEGCEVNLVVAVPDARLGQLLVAVVEAAPASLPTKSEILRRLRLDLAPQFVPHRFYAIDAIPRTAGGKLRRGELRDRLAASTEGFVRL